MSPPPEPPDHNRLGRGMIIAAWVVGLGLLTLLFGDFLESERNPNRQVLSRQSDAGGIEVLLQRNRYAHYVARGRINGEPVDFLVDTGASDVSVPGRIAMQLGLERGQPMVYQTANGNVTGYRTRIDRLELGELVLHDVAASINPTFDGDEVLLGMSVLKRLEFTQRGDTLILRPLRDNPS